jgi:K+-sensing histidine kinase KdpD
MALTNIEEKSLTTATIRGGTLDAVERVMSAITSSSSHSPAVSIRQPNLRLVPRDPIVDLSIYRSSEKSTRTAVMACLVAGNSGNAALLRKASEAAREHNGELYAIVVDSQRTRFDKVQVRGLVDDAVLGRDLGAKIVWLDSSDVVGELLQFARQLRIGRIFVTRDRPTLSSRLFGRAVYSDLLSRAEGFRVDVVGFERGN